jgi:hypothetical protein
MADISEFLTAREAARLMNRDISALTRYVKQGLLHPVWKGGVRLFLREEIEKFQPPPVGNPQLVRRKCKS